jgi:flagellar biosynthesis/type III secretory pathway ATPase
MASTPEKKVKDAVKKILNAHEAYYFSPVTGGFGTSGVPDIVACIKGKFIGIEAKAGKGKPTALQEKNLINIMNTGGIAVLVNERGIETLKLFLDAELPEQGMFLDLIKEK